MKVKFIPLDFDYVDYKSGVIVRIWGKTSEGKRICVIDTTPAYFWVIPHKNIDIKRYLQKISEIKLDHAGRLARVIDVQLKDKKFMGQEVKAVQVFVNNPKDIGTIKDVLKEFPETKEKKELDIGFITRYIIDKEVRPLVWQIVEGKEILDKEYGDPDVDIILEARNIKEAPDNEQEEFTPKVLAFDIETEEFEIGKGKILMISLANNHIKKVFTWKHFKNPPEEVEFVKDEAELIEKFIEFIKKHKPDCITGYFSDGFDWPYLRARADKHKIKLDLGLDGGNVSLRGGAVQTAEIRGLVHVDLFKFVDNILSPNLQSETVKLNDVARELIGEEKIKVDLGKMLKEIKNDSHGKEEELRKFALYNLQDSVITAKLFYHLWPNITELTKVVQESPFDVSRSAYSQLVEDHILHHLKHFNEIAESRPIRDEIEERRRRPKYIGAFVKEPVPGLYEDVAVFDFRSFWPNIIVSFNISSPTVKEKKEKGDFETPEFEYENEKKKFFFSKDKGFIPQILNNLLEKRKEVKAELRKKPGPILSARDYALKTLSNATYGYFGFFGARYYCPEGAASATAIGRYYIHKTIEDIEKSSFNVLYSDTDSIMFLLGKKNKEDALKVLKKINDSLPGTMELELEKFYQRGIFVSKRTGETGGAKKKYALLGEDGVMKVRGFESVRRDRCILAKKTQDYVLKKVLEEGKPESSLKHVKAILNEVSSGKAKNDELIIKTQITRAIEDYTNIGPHVEVAKKMRSLGLPIGAGTVIEYIVAKGKEKLIRERAKMPDEVKEGEYDSDYYMDNQIIPPIEGIFGVFGITPEQLKELKKQKKLLDF